jgi:hypothetical protein
VRGSHAFGTDIRRGFDSKLLGKAIAQPGIDLRYWVSLGTVCTLDPETGSRNTKDKLAIYNDSAGVDVDVELEPLGQPCTCKYAGIQAGDVTIMAPIRPGDIVLVECPDGDLFTPVITHILHSRSARQPTENRKPIFDNNRLLIHSKSVPIDIRTAGASGDPVQVLIEQDGTVTTTATRINHGDENVTEQFLLGTSYRKAEDALFQQLETAITSLNIAAIISMPAFQPGFAAMAAALATFKASAAASSAYLSDTNFGK